MYRIRRNNWCAGSYLKRSLKGLEVKKVLAKAMHATLTCPSGGEGSFIVSSGRLLKCSLIALGARGSAASDSGS
jgi:hypothetical protein